MDLDEALAYLTPEQSHYRYTPQQEAYDTVVSAISRLRAERARLRAEVDGYIDEIGTLRQALGEVAS